MDGGIGGEAPAMKVAIVTTRHGPQDDRIYFKQALSLAKRMDVVLIAPDDGHVHEWPRSVTYRLIPRRLRAAGRLRSLADAIRAVCREKPDFCHLHDLDLALGIPFIRLFAKAKVIYDSHEVFTRENLVLDGRARGIAWLTEQVEKVLVSVAHHVVTAVDPDARVFRGVKTPRSIILNYPRLSLFVTRSQDVAAMAMRREDRLPIVYQGTMSRDRGLFHMLEAVALAKTAEPRILLRLIGLEAGQLRQEAEQRISELGVGSHVEITGWLRHEKMAVAMKSSLIGLVPLQPNEKYNHALPIKLLEYMACGLPVIAARLPLMERYVNDCGGGLLYDSTHPEELAHCVLELLADPERRRRMGENGLRAVQDRWNWEKMEGVLFGIYESLGASFEKGI
jgi:glycosyltransferase involved in cell wall biosynthesis